MAQDPSDVLEFNEQVEMLYKAIALVSAELQAKVANKDEICKNLRGQCAIYNPIQCYNKYLESLKTLVKRLKRPLELPPHSNELKDDTKQLLADVDQVLFQYGVKRAHYVCFPRVVDTLVRVRGGAPIKGDSIGDSIRDAATRTPAPMEDPSARKPKTKRMSPTEKRKAHARVLY